MPPAPRETVVVDGIALANARRAALAEEVEALVKRGRRPPCLAVLLVGDDPASASYIRGFPAIRATRCGSATSREGVGYSGWC